MEREEVVVVVGCCSSSAGIGGVEEMEGGDLRRRTGIEGCEGVIVNDILIVTYMLFLLVFYGSKLK